MSPKGRPEGESGPERVSAKGSPVSERRAGARVTQGVAEPTAVARPVPGPESRLPDDHHGALRLWLRLLTCTLMIERRIKSRLRERFDTTLPRFDLMAQLERAPGGLTMSELSRRLMVTGGNVTGLVDPLVAEGLVERWVVAMMAGVGERDRGELAALLARLKQSVTEHGGD